MKIGHVMSFILTRWLPNKLTLSLVISVLVCLSTSAQVNQSIRYEIPILNNDAAFEVTTAEEGGLFLNRYYLGKNIDQIEIIRLDTAFQEIWRGALDVEKGLTLVGKKSDGNYLYFLFVHPLKNVFHFYKIGKDDGIYKLHLIRSYIRFNPTEFQITQNNVLIGGYFNKVPLVLHYNMVANQSKILPGIFNEEGELTQVKIHVDGSFHVLISAYNYLRQKTIWIKNYHPDGTLINNFALETNENKSLLFARSVKNDSNMMIIAGVYGKRHSEYSRGLFTATIDPNGYQQIRYYNFGDLENFFKYMKVKRENRIRQKIVKRKTKGKKIRFNYRFLVHEVTEQNGQYIMLGEAFYPTYHSLSTSYGNFFMPTYAATSRYVRGDQIFDGFQYTHAAIIGFDKNGDLLWDNSFAIEDVKTWTLEQFVRLELQEKRIVLLYLYNNQIRSKIIQDNHVIEGKEIVNLKSQWEGDVPVKDEKSISRLNYWYNSYLYAFGVQDIENYSNEEAPAKRKVFFINKITYD